MRAEPTTRWTRRALLGAGAASLAGAAAGCGWFTSPPPEPPPPDPLEPMLLATRELAGRYARTLSVHPDLAGRLEPLHAGHVAHVTALLELIDRPELATPGAASPRATGRPGTAEDRGVPSDTDEALGRLRELEQEAQEYAFDVCLRVPVERAGLLGSICAARASHLEVLA